jgi:hypothetical protein
VRGVPQEAVGIGLKHLNKVFEFVFLFPGGKLLEHPVFLELVCMLLEYEIGNGGDPVVIFLVIPRLLLLLCILLTRVLSLRDATMLAILLRVIRSHVEATAEIILRRAFTSWTLSLLCFLLFLLL